MDWLSRPKVLFGLLVNAAYILYCLAAPPAHPRTGPYGLTTARRTDAAPAKRAPLHVPLPPPPVGPSKATSYYAKESDQLNIYLTHDLTLVSRPGHTLLLSPTFTVQGHNPEPPRSVLLRFVSFSGAQYYDNDTQFVITADGVVKWPRGWRGEDYATQPYARVPHSVTAGDDGQVVETFGEEIPYDDFIEIISARQVILALGPDKVELTADQVEALRDMHRHLPQPPDAAGNPGY